MEESLLERALVFRHVYLGRLYGIMHVAEKDIVAFRNGFASEEPSTDL
jgi:hypothetical protein